MLFDFVCQDCQHSFECDYAIGKAPRNISCVKCSGLAKRVYSSSIGISVSRVTHPSTFGEQMKAKNAEAGFKMQGQKPPVRISAYDYGDGDIREVGSK